MSNMIYRILFGQESGAVHCPFHEGDNEPSLHISSDGKFNCFGCGEGGASPAVFIMRHYNIDYKTASRFNNKLNNLPQYKYQELAKEDIDYLDSIGVARPIQRYMKRSANGKLVYPHIYQGVIIDHTWFNYPSSTAHNPQMGKYNRDKGSTSGFLTPYSLLNKQTIIIVEGEKDMLTMLSQGIPAVSIVGGARTKPYMVQKELEGKDIVIIYDCDQAGRDGAEDLTHWLYEQGVNSVRNVDLGLGSNGEDVNDWFQKFKLSKQELLNLIKNTPVEDSDISGYSPKVFRMLRKVQKQLTVEEQEELLTLLLEKNNKEEENNE